MLRPTARLAQQAAPLRMAIVGAGPSGFYTASRLLSLLPPASTQGQALEIHMYDRLPTPYGLVRYGVAPDHPEVKNCQHKFDELANDSRFRFFGNVNIESPQTNQAFHDYTYPEAVKVPIASLYPYYNTILLTYGASLSNALHVPGSTADPAGPLDNVYPALAFVSWYNGHPAYAHLSPNLDVEDATVVGHGNVAIDCARMLLKDPDLAVDGHHKLSETDVPEPVLERLRASKVRHVQAVGRRGPGQVAFTTKEFRELVNLPGVEYQPVTGEIMDEAKATAHERMRKRLLDLMSKPGKGNGSKRFSLGFLKSPQAFLGDSRRAVRGVRWGLNTLLSPTHLAATMPANTPPTVQAVASPTGKTEESSTQLVIESVGYRSEPLGDVPFDAQRGRVLNEGGRVMRDGVMVRAVSSGSLWDEC